MSKVLRIQNSRVWLLVANELARLSLLSEFRRVRFELVVTWIRFLVVDLQASRFAGLMWKWRSSARDRCFWLMKYSFHRNSFSEIVIKIM